MFDPERKPREPTSVRDLLAYRQGYFDPKIGEDEDGFTVADAESLGWRVDLFHASKPFLGRGLIEVHAGGSVLDSNEGRYGVLKAIYDYELKEHQRVQARALEVFGRLVRVRRQQLQAISAANAARKEARAFGSELSDEEWVAWNGANDRMGKELRKAIRHSREATKHVEELGTFSLLELPDEFIDYLKETKPPPKAAKKGKKA